MDNVKLKINQTPQDQERELAAQERAREQEIVAKREERNAKIQALHKVQKRNKILIISIIVVLFVTMMTFGIYNIFVKKSLTEDQVVGLARSQVNYYPQAGVTDFLHNSAQSLFDKYIVLDTKYYEYADVNEDSIEIYNVITMNNNAAQVYWSMDVDIKEKDVEVTDPEFKAKLIKNGLVDSTENLSTDEQSTETPAEPTEETPVATTTDASVEDDSYSAEASLSLVDSDGNVLDTADLTANDDSGIAEEATTAETTTEMTTEATVEETEVATGTDSGMVTIENTSIDQYNKNTKEITTYYISGDKIMQKGKVITTRYTFTAAIEYYKTDTGAAGYRLGSEMHIAPFDTANQTDFTDITELAGFEFNKDAIADKETTDKVKIKVDKTLGDLYTKRDVSQDFFNSYKFNTFEGTYKGISSFVYYTEPNQYGFNSKVTYKIEYNGFTYETDAYLIIEPDGNSWVIKGYL